MDFSKVVRVEIDSLQALMFNRECRVCKHAGQMVCRLLMFRNDVCNNRKQCELFHKLDCYLFWIYKLEGSARAKLVGLKGRPYGKTAQF